MAGGAVNPGPFSLETLPPISGQGEANLVVTDMLGRSIATTMPFYVSSALLRPGLTDYAGALGLFRRNYGFSNFDYGGMAATAAVRHGLSDALTLEGRAEATAGFVLGGLGGVLRAGRFGILSASYSLSDRGGTRGSEISLGYEYQARSFSIGVRHSRRDADFADLGSLEHPISSHARQLFSATSSASLGRAGSLGFAYIDVKSGSVRHARLANVSWSVPLVQSSRLHATLSREIGARGWSGGVTLSFNLGGQRGNMAASLAKDMSGPESWQIDYARPIMSQGGLGWSGSATGRPGARPYLRGDLTWRASMAELRGGIYGADAVRAWLGISGTVVVMDGAFFPANRIADSFVLVSTEGEPDVPVRYENQLVGHTDSQGRLLIPWVSAYYQAQYEIDPLSLPGNMRTPTVSQRVSVARGSGTVITFPIRQVRPLLAKLTNARGLPVPAGSVASINGATTSYIGWDGLLFIEDAADQNRIVITQAGGETCTLDIRAGAHTQSIADAGVHVCR
ncbi:fimbria/pilus outer membrane usher protein [Sphingobium sp. B11D3B]|uniref:fimbria/pilus outer membrane usher protein n=1 Tax=Sphingobium sp. B11D3B TaxID=2940575 RepID=UPI00222686FD|nr:fimbria/pilus outer membrane usher protein [Sphingobium sp. B11D3B]